MMKRVLVTPLDWGLGHATRCIPIIRELLARSCVVYIAASGDSLILLQKEFPALTFFTLPGYEPIYPSSGNMVLKMALQLPKFRSVIRREHRKIAALIEEFRIDLVISDNRYGCWSSKIPSVVITHQLNILMPQRWAWLASFVRRINTQMIKRFSYCWIPDYPGEFSLAGELTRYDADALKHIVYVGPLSRFSRTPDLENKYDVLGILSGPEPQRTLFEKLLKAQLDVSGAKYFIVRGIPSLSDSKGENETDFLTGRELEMAIQQSSLIIARSGYSTVMDLCALGRKAIFIPTPNQTEQEYLAKRFKDENVAYAMPQHAFNLATALAESKVYTGFNPRVVFTNVLLTKALDQALN
jgi:uncharacterized protein (TIGR00661 family)